MTKDKSTKSRDHRFWERVGNLTADKEARKKIDWEIKAEANPALNLIKYMCFTMSGSGFWRKNL